ncbi:MAG: carbohydrate deacetylase [Planctomycetota bacterium]|jgi:hopanoid biosynthesis associated protein HpnK
MKQLIVNADDFGLTSEVNHGIIQCFKKGIVTSASLLAVGEGFFDAVQLIKKNPLLDVGAHLTLTEETSILSKQEIPTLVDDYGKFRKNTYQFFYDYIRKRILKSEVKKEFEAQIVKIYKSGIKISHIDSHQHIHLFPDILDIVLELARKYGIKYIRCPNERIEFSNIFIAKKIPRLIQQITLNSFCFFARNRLKRYAVDHFFGFFDGGHLEKCRLLKILAKQHNGISEIMCHPGSYLNGKTSKKYSHWNYNWQDELKCLLDKDVINVIKQKRIKLISFSEIN